MVHRIVEADFVMYCDIVCTRPRAERRVGLGIPDIAQQGMFALDLDENHDPFLAIFVPCDGAAMCKDCTAGLCIVQTKRRVVFSHLAAGDEVALIASVEGFRSALPAEADMTLRIAIQFG